jgi:arabinose-5-phosphate isomerase
MLADVKNDLMYLLNILEYIGKIQKYTEKIDSHEEFYEINDQMNFNGSINLLANIGENVSRISNELKAEYTEMEWRQIKNFRNKIVHDYVGIDIILTYDIIKNDLSKLQQKIEEIIKIKTFCSRDHIRFIHAIIWLTTYGMGRLRLDLRRVLQRNYADGRILERSVVMIAYFRKQLDTIADSLTSLPDEDFRKLADSCTGILKKGGKIIASGLGKNVPVCEKFVGTMNSLGMDARFLHTNSAVHGDIGMVSPNDIALILSKSGDTIESIILAEHLLVRGAETWYVSFNKKGKLSSMLERGIVLRLKEEGDPWNIVPNNSTTVYLMLLQGLAIQIADSMNIQLHDFKINHPGGGIGEKLKDIS